MKDIIGQELAVGDWVAFNPPRFKGLTVGQIIKFTPKGVRVEFKDYRNEINSTALSFSDVIKLQGEALTVFLLKKG